MSRAPATQNTEERAATPETAGVFAWVEGRSGICRRAQEEHRSRGSWFGRWATAASFDVDLSSATHVADVLAEKQPAGHAGKGVDLPI